MGTPVGGGRAVRTACLFAVVAVANSAGAEAGRVRGTVVDRQGKPAAGAKVWTAKLSFLEPLESQEAVADDSGAFTVEVGPGQWAVWALKGNEGGRGGWDSIATVGERKDASPVTVRLGPPSTLHGRLLDAESGRPITGGVFALDDARRVAVDAEGRFEAPGLELTNHEAYPLCPGFARQRILFDTTGRPDAELELKIPRAGRVVGRVTDAAGKPVAGATVGLRTSGSVFSGSALWQSCGDDGRFNYDGKPLGRTGRLAARAPGYQDEEREDVVTLDASTPTTLDFTLRPDPTKARANAESAKPAAVSASHRDVAGKVVGPDGKPVASALVRWGLSMSSDEIPEIRTDERGAFRLPGVTDEANVLSVMAKGLAPAFPQIDAGGDREAAVTLNAGATVRGRVIDDAGLPIAGVRVVPQIANPRPNWGGSVYLDELKATTDPDGRFELDGMPEGVTCDVVAEGRSAVRQRVLSLSDATKNVITLLGGGVIRGRVVDPAGHPVRNFRVQLGIPRGANPGDPVGGYFAGYGGVGLSFTRGDGEFTVSGLTAGNLHLLTVVADEFGKAEVDRVIARSATRPDPADVLTIKLGPTHSLRVRVFREGGKFVEGARVTVVQDEGQGEDSWADSVTARVDARGWADFPALAFGKGTVVIRAAGLSRRRLEWAKGEEEFEVDLRPEARLTGTVLDASGKPVLRARVVLSPQSGPTQYLKVGEADGRFSADGLDAGEYQLNLINRAGQVPGPFPQTIELRSGETLTKDIRLD